MSAIHPGSQLPEPGTRRQVIVALSIEALSIEALSIEA